MASDINFNYYDSHEFHRAKHSTNQAMLSIVDNIQRAIENKEYSCGIFLDFTKAFDTVNHGILLKKMEMYGLMQRNCK